MQERLALYPDTYPERNTAGAVTPFTLTAKVRSALHLWLSGFPSENTRRAYACEISAFAAFAGRENVAEAVSHFLALEDGQAHAVADAWRAQKLEGGLSPASINRSMSALNSLVRSARRHGLTSLRLEAKGVKSKPYRDTKGPGVRGVQNMLAVAQEQRPEKAARDAAILRIAYGLGLRRGEIASLNIGNLDLAAGTLSVLGKGRTEREKMTLPSNVKSALAAWLAVRGSADPSAPLFIAMDNHFFGGRISGSGIYHVIRSQLGARAGVKARPHGLRHTAITAASMRSMGIIERRGPFRATPLSTQFAGMTTIAPTMRGRWRRRLIASWAEGEER